MTPAEDTRQRLIEAATREFAERGIHAASLLEITRLAGQRNRGAVHYHFGSREGVLAAARSKPDDDIRSVLDAVIRPAVELGDLGWQGRCYLMILAEIAAEDQEAVHPDVSEVLERTGGSEAFALLMSRLPEMPEPLLVERLTLVTGFYLRSIADRARSLEHENGRAQLETESFLANLVLMSEAMLTAPVPDDVRLHHR
jgi:AcrR family transcriptional regulator